MSPASQKIANPISAKPTSSESGFITLLRQPWFWAAVTATNCALGALLNHALLSKQLNLLIDLPFLLVPVLVAAPWLFLFLRTKPFRWRLQRIIGASILLMLFSFISGESVMGIGRHLPESFFFDLLGAVFMLPLLASNCIDYSPVPVPSLQYNIAAILLALYTTLFLPVVSLLMIFLSRRLSTRSLLMICTLLAGAYIAKIIQWIEIGCK